MSAQVRTVLLVLAVALGVLAAGLGRAGLLAPGETAVVDAALAGRSERAAVAVARAGLALAGPSETGARLGGAALAVLATLALALAVARVSDVRTGGLAGVAYAACPLVVAGARHAGPSGLAQSGLTLVFAALLVAVWGGARGRALAWGAVAASAAVAAWLGGPAVAVAPALIGAGAAVVLRGRAESGVRRAVGAAALLAGFAASRVAMTDDAQVAGWEAPIERLAHALFPWTGLVAVGLARLCAATREDEARGEGGVRVAAFATFTAALLAQGPGAGPEAGAFVGAAPIAVALALLVRDAERGAYRTRAAAAAAALATLVVLRDAALFPRTLLAPLADGGAAPVASLATPGAGAWLVGRGAARAAAGLACGAAPPLAYAAVIALLALIGGCGALYLGAGRRAAVVPAVGVAVALLLAHGLDPALASRLSPRAAWSALRAARGAGEPVAVFRAARGEASAALYGAARVSELRSESEAAAWLAPERAARAWLLLGEDALPAVNHAYRAARAPLARANVPLVAAPAAGTWVAASRLAAGSASRNPLDEVVAARPFARDGFEPHARGEPARFDDAVELLGVELPAGRAVRVGGEVAIAYHFRVLRPVAGTYRVFVHVDGPCPRINADHDPAGGRYPVSHWLAGDYVRDAHRFAIPLYCRPGRYVVYVGFYQGGRRMTVRGGEHDGDGRVVAARLDAR